jgi:hypothetical protein
LIEILLLICHCIDGPDQFKEPTTFAGWNDCGQHAPIPDTGGWFGSRWRRLKSPRLVMANLILTAANNKNGASQYDPCPPLGAASQSREQSCH